MAWHYTTTEKLNTTFKPSVDGRELILLDLCIPSMAEESEDIVLKASQVINDFIAARESIMRAEEKLSREFSEKIGVVRSRSESVLEMLKRVHALIPASREDYFKKSEGLLKTFLFDLGYAIEDAGLAEIKTACTYLTEGICQEPFSLLENAIQGTRRLL